MKISQLFLLGAMLLMPPLVTRAQAAGPAPGGSSEAARNSLHVSIDWAKARLDEIGATLASLEKKLGDLKSDTRTKAGRASQTASEAVKRATH